MFVAPKISFEIQIRPLSYYQYLKQNRHRKYITKKGKEYKEILQKHFAEFMKDIEIVDGPCKLDVEFYFDNKRKNDVDNFCKPIMDCMTGIVYTDDCLITDLHIKKFYSDKPNIIIHIN